MRSKLEDIEQNPKWISLVVSVLAKEKEQEKEILLKSLVHVGSIWRMHEQTLGNKQKCFLTQTVIQMEEEGNTKNRFLWYLGLHTVQKQKEHKK